MRKCITGGAVSTSFWIPALAIGLGAAIVGWGVARTATRALGHHRRHLAHLNQVQLVELFLFVEPVTFLRINLIVLLIATVVFGWLAGLYGAALAMLLTAVAPRALYLWLRKRRLRALERQLPDIADSLASSLRAGLGLGQAIARVAQHQPPPAAQEFALLVREHRLGIPLEQALSDLAVRSDLRDLHMLVATLGIARDLGGGLADALERFGASIRRRLVMEDRIRALTAQGRLQGIVMGILPIALGAVLFVLEPVQMRKLFTEPVGWLTIGGVVLLEFGGFLLLRRIVSIRV
jgi:tight adherence protein B